MKTNNLNSLFYVDTELNQKAVVALFGLFFIFSLLNFNVSAEERLIEKIETERTSTVRISEKDGVLTYNPLLSSPLVSGITDRILIVHSGDTDSYRLVEQSFRARLNQYFDKQSQRLLNVKSINLSSLDTLAKIIDDSEKTLQSNQRIDLIVTIGARAAFNVLSRFPAAPVLSIFIPKQTYHVILDEIAYLKNQRLTKMMGNNVEIKPAIDTVLNSVAKNRTGSPNKYKIGGKRLAIYLDQPNERLVLLAKKIVQLNKYRRSNTIVNVGLFAGEISPSIKAIPVKNTQCMSDEVFNDNQSLMAGVSFHKVNVTSRYLKRALKTSDAVIVTPQLVKQSPNAIKWMIYMAYQRKVPVIGFSKAFADAGAIAAVYSTPENIGRQGAEWFLQNGHFLGKKTDSQSATAELKKLRESREFLSLYPQYFRVSINLNVAKTLNYIGLNALALQQSLMVYSLKCEDVYQPIPTNINNQQLTRR